MASHRRKSALTFNKLNEITLQTCRQVHEAIAQSMARVDDLGQQQSLVLTVITSLIERTVGMHDMPPREALDLVVECLREGLEEDDDAAAG